MPGAEQAVGRRELDVRGSEQLRVSKGAGLDACEQVQAEVFIGVCIPVTWRVLVQAYAGECGRGCAETGICGGLWRGYKL